MNKVVLFGMLFCVFTEDAYGVQITNADDYLRGDTRQRRKVCGRMQKCKELDELGGQPIITAAIEDATDKWINENLSKKSMYFLDALPKSALKQDRVKKKRQERIEEDLEEIRTHIKYVYSQALALHLKAECFSLMVDQYKSIIISTAWKQIGDRQDLNANKAIDVLTTKINKLCMTVEKAYAEILREKEARFQAYAAKNPDVAVNAVAIQRARKAEVRAAAAENEAQRAKVAAWAAEQEAADANAAADAARRDAAGARQRAADLERKAVFGF